MKVAIDIGHARGTGATGNGLDEHEVCAELGKCLKGYLDSKGVDSSIIDFPDLRNGEDLERTARAANDGGYVVGLSLHCDCSENEDARGAHVRFFPVSVKGARLAQCVAKDLVRWLPGRSQACVADQKLYILKKTRMPWVLVECGFLSNEGDARVLRDSPEVLAKAIGDGVVEYLSKYEK